MIFCCLVLCNSCSNPSNKKSNGSRLIVMTTELKNDSTLIRMYDSLHSVKGVWPALLKANQASGIEEIMIYRFDNRLMMMIRVPEDADMEKINKLYVDADPKVKEWGVMMDGFQKALPGVDSSRKWVEMKLIHHYVDGGYVENK